MNRRLSKRVLLAVLLTAGLLQYSAAQEATVTHRMDVSPGVVIVDGVEYTTTEKLGHAIESLPSGSEIRWFNGCLHWNCLPLKPEKIKVSEFKKFCFEHGVKLIIETGW